MPHLNIEIKARCSDHNAIREILTSKNAKFEGTDHQIDTYFHVRPARPDPDWSGGSGGHGRLKLREGNIERCLIYYDRRDKQGPKESSVILFKTETPSVLKEMLTRSLGVLTVVDKQREIYFLDNVKFHLDTVQSLGTFVEIEAIDEDGSIGKEKLLQQCQFFLELFKISENELVSVSYSDLLMGTV